MDSETKILFPYPKFNTTSPKLEKRGWGHQGGRERRKKGEERDRGKKREKGKKGGRGRILLLAC